MITSAHTTTFQKTLSFVFSNRLATTSRVRANGGCVAIARESSRERWVFGAEIREGLLATAG
jgi:hypothetical protein